MKKKYDAIYDAVHDLKRIAPLLSIFIDTNPKAFCDVVEAHGKIGAILNNVICDLCKCLDNKRPEPQAKDGTLL